MQQTDLLKKLSFGARVAEDETAELAKYFVETDQWNRIFGGEIDVIRGDKGAGKSAIYSLLVAKADDLFDKKILLVTAEQPRGTTVFKDLVAEPPTSENEFIGLWKLYIATLIAQTIKEYGIDSDSSGKKLVSGLEDQKLLEAEFDLAHALKQVRTYVSGWFKPKSLEGSFARVYLDFRTYDRISLKIFLRSDIWRRIVEGGFREASHITKVAILDWEPPALLNLIIRRLLSNKPLLDRYQIDAAKVLTNFNEQEALFYRFFPRQVEQGTKKRSTLDWMISRTADGTNKTAPRELIHLLNTVREKQIQRLERGEAALEGDQLFERSVFKPALEVVSEARLVQTVYAEYPDLKPSLIELEGEKTEQTTASLATIWKISEDDAKKRIQALIEIGFFQERGGRDHWTYWVPFLYRDALSMSQGAADEY